MSSSITSSTTVLLGILTIAGLAAVAGLDAPGEREMRKTDSAGSSSTSRELWRVVFGAGATLVALSVCSSPWEHCFVYNWNAEDQGGNIEPMNGEEDQGGNMEGRNIEPMNGEDQGGGNIESPGFVRLVMMLFKILSPQVICVPWFLTAGYAAIILRHRLKNRAGWIISKRLCPMVVWIGIDKPTYDSFFGQAGSTSVESNMAGSVDIERTTVQAYFQMKHPLRKAPNLKVAVPWPGSKQLAPEEDAYYFCLQGWDRKTLMWKEAMVVKRALGTDGNIGKGMEMVKVMPWWARAVLVVLGLGYVASVLSRFAHELRVSPLEVMCSWIMVVVVVEAGILPLLVVPSYQGIHLHLNYDRFHEVLQEYIRLSTTHPHALTCLDLWSFVLCILSTFFLFLLLNPPLIYYYYKLPTCILSFVSLILFTVLSGAGIASFAVMLFSPPHHFVFALTHSCSCSPSSSSCMLVLTLWLLLTGLASYILAVTETTLNWPLFELQDHSFFSFMIPHIGS